MKIALFFMACIFSLAVTAQEKALPADTILSTAYQQAKKEKKNVFVIFHASWCGWCRKMDTAMQDVKCKKFFDDNYVTVHLTVLESEGKKTLENPGAKELLSQYHGDSHGIPFWVILDESGKLLSDCLYRKDEPSKDGFGHNIGCPSTEKEVAAFIDILKRTSQLSQQQLAIIAKRFNENKPVIAH